MSKDSRYQALSISGAPQFSHNTSIVRILDKIDHIIMNLNCNLSCLGLGFRNVTSSGYEWGVAQVGSDEHQAHLTDEVKNYSATKSAVSMIPCGNLDVLGEMEMFVGLCVLYGCWRYSGFVSWVWVGCGVGCVFGCAWRCLQWPRLCRWWSLPKPDGHQWARRQRLPHMALTSPTQPTTHTLTTPHHSPTMDYWNRMD